MNIDVQHQGITSRGYNNWAVNRLSTVIVFCYADYDTCVQDRFPTRRWSFKRLLSNPRVYMHIRSLARQLVKRP